jgi:hypothetical protein
MPQNAYAKILVSVNGGAPISGAVTAAANDTVQLSGEQNVLWDRAYWEITAFPPGWSPGGAWLPSASGDKFTYTGITPPSFALGAVWGKWLFTLTVNLGIQSGISAETLTDKTTGIQVLSPNGVSGVAKGEEGQFDATRHWAGALDAAIRAIDAAVAGGVAAAGLSLVYATLAPYFAPTNGSDARTALHNANTTAGASARVYLSAGTYTVESALSLTNVEFTPGAKLKPASGVTITITGTITAPPNQQIFDVSAGGSFSLPVGEVHYAWFGPDRTGTNDCLNATTKALSALAAGSTLRLLAGDYKHSASFDVPTKIALLGAGKASTRLFLSVAATRLVRFNAADSGAEGVIFDGNFLASSMVVEVAASRTRLRSVDIRKAVNTTGRLLTVTGVIDSLDIEDSNIEQDSAVAGSRADVAVNFTAAATSVRVRRSLIKAAAYGIYLSGGGIVLEDVAMGNFTAIGVIVSDVAAGGLTLRRVRGTQSETVPLLHMQAGGAPATSRDHIVVDNTKWTCSGNPMFLTCQQPVSIRDTVLDSITGVTVTPTAGQSDNPINCEGTFIPATIRFRNADGTAFEGPQLSDLRRVPV